MGLNIYPTPNQNVLIDSSGNTVKVANGSGLIAVGNPLHTTIVGTPTVSISNPAITAKTIKSALSVTTTQTLQTLVNSSNCLVIHNISISQHITSGQAGDRLGIMMGYATTSGGYTQSATNPTTSTTIASCYEEKGTTVYDFGETGLRLPAGNNLYFFADFYNSQSVNFVITVLYREVTP